MTLLVAAVVAAFVAHLVKGITGFGSALVLVPVLTALWGPREAIFVTVCLDLLIGLYHIWNTRRLVSLLLVLTVFVPMLAGQWLGTELLTTIPERPLRRLVGGAIALFALEIVLRPVRPGRGELEALPERAGRLLGGAAAISVFAGFLGGLVGTPGPPIILFMRRYFRETFFRAQLLWIFSLGAASLVAMLWLRGVGQPDTLARAGMLVPPTIGGAMLGTAVSGRLDRVAFSRLVGAVVLVAGVALALA